MSENSNDSSSIASEVIAAALGGAISTSVLYPLEVVKTRLQAQDTSSEVDSSCSGKDEEEYHDPHNDDVEEKNGDAQPMAKNKINMISVARQLYETEGPGVFARGLPVSALQSALEKALYFFSYTVFQKLVPSQHITTQLLLGYLAEWSHLPITLPVDAWTTRIQTSHDKQAMAILCAMLSDPGRDFYKGLSAYYLLCLKPALQYTVYEQVKRLWLMSSNSRSKSNNNARSKTRKTLSALEAFVLGMLARAVATVVVFPFLRAKVLMQTQKSHAATTATSNNDSQDKTTSTATASIMTTTSDVLMQQWKQAGISGLYQGLGPELTRGVLSSALMLMIKERIAAMVRRR